MTRRTHTPPHHLNQSSGHVQTAGKQQPRQSVTTLGRDDGQLDRLWIGYLTSSVDRQNASLEGEGNGQHDRQVTGQKEAQLASQQDGPDVARPDVIREDQPAVALGKVGEGSGAGEQDSGYVDIPRRIAWERLASPGKRCTSVQVSLRCPAFTQVLLLVLGTSFRSHTRCKVPLAVLNQLCFKQAFIKPTPHNPMFIPTCIGASTPMCRQQPCQPYC